MEAIVVSDIKDKLSPNIAPPIVAPITTAGFSPIDCDKATAIGTTAAIVPQEVPTESDIKAETTNRPEIIN